MMMMMMICTGRALAIRILFQTHVQPTSTRLWRSASFQIDFPKAGYSRFGAVKPGRCQFFIMIGSLPFMTGFGMGGKLKGDIVWIFFFFLWEVS